MVKLMVEIAGLKFKNPVLNASGMLGLTASSLKRLVKAGAGGVVTKSIGLKPRVGNPNPTIVEVSCGLLNCMGLPSPGVEEASEELRCISGKLKVPLIASIYGFNVEEYVKVAKDLHDAGVDGLELNCSCPHVEKVRLIGQNPKLVGKVTKAVKNSVEIPVFVKLTANVTDIVLTAKAAAEAGADALTLINTVKGLAVDIHVEKPILSGIFGGLSGSALKPIALACVYEVYKAKLNIPIIGCGGVYCWKDAVEFFLAGASLIQVGTGLMVKGFKVFGEILGGLEKHLKRKGYLSVDEL
ncbi:MAG: dihydroorotate dehydrogenase, partial [Candidatus Bathyarchaeota archaeon]